MFRVRYKQASARSRRTMAEREARRGPSCLQQVLSETHVGSILEQVLGDTSYKLVWSEVKPAADGLIGFLAEHIRVLLHVRVNDDITMIPIFVKRVPHDNGPKGEFIEQQRFFHREAMVMRLMAHMGGADGPSPFTVRAYVYTERMLVMPDLCAAGYSVHPVQTPLDLPHVQAASASLARFHAAFANYETRDTLAATTRDTFHERNKELLSEVFFCDSAWMRAAAKLTADFLHAFSSKYTRDSVPDLEGELVRSYICACDSLATADDTLNVIVHKDLWNNNIMFKYEGGLPANAVLVDYQSVRYAPPAFDLMSFLEMTTSRALRERHERAVLDHYWAVFWGALDPASRGRASELGYCAAELARRCERARMWASFEAAAIFPFILMDARAAQLEFDDPASFQRTMQQDRSAPVLHHARHHAAYRQRVLDASETYVQMFVLK